MRILSTLFLEKKLKYTGLELSSLWIYKNTDIQGDAVVSFIGPAELDSETMVDMEDVKANDRIYSESMVHFLGEFFDLDLEKTVYRQRLLMVLIKEALEKRIGEILSRKGDDIYDGDSKLTVSIATSSPTSTLIHAGINVLSQNTPVKTRGLFDYDVEPSSFAKEILKEFKQEIESSWLARCKVIGVKF